MAAPLHGPPETMAAPVQFVDPGQLFVNPPPAPVAPKYSYNASPRQTMRPQALSPPQPPQPKIRPLTVDEALQFSPLASIIPFDAGVIPMIGTEVPMSHSAFSSKEQEEDGGKQLKALNEEAARTNGQSLMRDPIVKSLTELLDKNIVDHSFKLPAGVKALREGTTQHPRLSPLASLLLERTSLPVQVRPAGSSTSLPKPKAPTQLKKPSEASRSTSVQTSTLGSRSSQASKAGQTTKASGLARTPARSPEKPRPPPLPLSSPSAQLLGSPAAITQQSSSSSHAQTHPQQSAQVQGQARIKSEDPRSNNSSSDSTPLQVIPEQPRPQSETRIKTERSHSQQPTVSPHLPPRKPSPGQSQIDSKSQPLDQIRQQHRLLPAVHIPPVPAELKSTPSFTEPSRLASPVRSPSVPTHHQLAASREQAVYPSSPNSPNTSSTKPVFEIRVPPVAEEFRKYAQQSPAPRNHQEPTSSQVSGFQILLPGKNLSAPRETYKAYSTTVDPKQESLRAEADASLQELQNVLTDVFEAESEAQTSGLGTNTEGLVTSTTGPEGEIIVLAPSILIKLDSSLRKVIERRRFSSIPVDDVLQLQVHCERSMASAEVMQLSLRNDWPTLDDTARNVEANNCEQILKSARIILRTMTSGRADKQIVPEERLQKCIMLLEKIVDSLILPTVEARSTGSDSSAFQLANTYKKQIGTILFECNKLMQILLDVLSKEEVAETAVNQVEYFVIRMLFVENGPTEKDSVLGIARFEGFRKLAMLVLVAIYTKYPEQRGFIINEILSSLQKLPTARQQGRQFKTDNNKRLQLVTVLLIRLVQASGVNISSKSTRAALREADKAGRDDDDDDDSENEEDDAEVADSEDDDEDSDDVILPTKLVNMVQKIHGSAVQSAWHIINFLVKRASTASKTGEQPHRHLLDMFVEDLINVLGMPEWPGAELLLQVLVNKMREFIVEPKTPAPTKTMALETLGTLGTAILDVTFDAQHAARALENDGSKLSVRLIEQLEGHMQGQLTDFDVVKWKGPFRAVLDRLQQKASDGQAASAQGYLLTKWTKTLIWGNKSASAEIDDGRISGGARDLAITLSRMAMDSKYHDENPMEIGETQARLAYLVSILHVGFCQAFAPIVSMLLDAITSDQITVRARGLKSVTQMLEKDPALLDRYPKVMALIMRCATDSSASVRDNSLSLLGKCISLRPSVEKDVIHTILNAATDSTVGIRKRSLKLLREAYLREESKESSDKQREWRRNIRALAANSIFRGIHDEESSVVELVQQIFEEIWLDPFRTSNSRESASTSDNMQMRQQASFVIQTICDHGDLAKPVQDLLRHSLSPKGKNAESSRKICAALVSCAFEGIINPEELPGAPPQHRTLQALAIFARVEPKLFTIQHVEHLKPYVSCLSNDDDLNLFRGVVVIFRCVLPTLPTLQQETLKKVEGNLLQVVPKLPKAELDEVASCLWTISKVLKSPDKLVKLVVSVLTNLLKMASAKDMGDELVKRVQRLMRIAGHFGKYCDFQPEVAYFKEKLPTLKGDLVASKIVSGLQPFTSADRPVACKAVAWEAIGMICQSWPRTFNHEGIAKDIQLILKREDRDLQKIIMTSIRDFFSTQDQAHDTEANALSKDPLAQGKLGGSMTATDNDGAAALIAQAYLKHILKISLSTTDEIALIATEVIASISRQGLIHPKEVGPALFALVTSPDPKVVAAALQQLKNLHSQHETLFEREYIRSIGEAFTYQKNIVKSTAGFVGSAPRAKLHHVFEVIKESKAKFVTKFLTNFCGRADFELAKLDASGEPPAHLEYARFLLENLPFFDFTRIEDVNLVITCLEKAVAATGSAVAHAINTEVLNMTIESVLKQSESQANGFDSLLDGIMNGTNGEADGVAEEDTIVVSSIEAAPKVALSNNVEGPTKPEVSPERLRQLTTAAIVLVLLWEARTFLRKYYNVNPGHQTKSKGRPLKGDKAKDPSRAPTKNGLVSGDKYLATIAATIKDLDSEQASLDRCRRFAELMAIDDELKVGKDDDEDMNDDIDDSLAVDEEGYDGSSRGLKRKNSTPGPGSTPKKRRSRPSKSDSRKSSEDVEMWE